MSKASQLIDQAALADEANAIAHTQLARYPCGEQIDSRSSPMQQHQRERHQGEPKRGLARTERSKPPSKQQLKQKRNAKQATKAKKDSSSPTIANQEEEEMEDESILYSGITTPPPKSQILNDRRRRAPS